MMAVMDVSIGELAKLTGVSVKTIRYYSDIGLLPEASRSAGGYRRYDEQALARLELIRSLRELGFDIATTQRVAENQTNLEAVARAQVGAIDAHIRQLKLRRVVLQAIAGGASRPEEVQRMTAFAKASADEARHIVEEFLDAVFTDHEDNPFAARMRSTLPELPEEPTEIQMDAWIELAGLVKDEEFRTRIREMIIAGERQRKSTGLSETDKATQAAGQAVLEKAGGALAAGTPTGGAGAQLIVDELVGLFAAAAAKSDSPTYRRELLAQLEQFSDRRVDHYWRLIGIINGWPERPDMIGAYEWLIEALRAAVG